jgi:hypothetical protein
VLGVIFAGYSAEEPLRWGYFAPAVVGLTAFAALAHALPEKARAAEPLPA